MKLPVEISFRNIPPTAWIESEVYKRAEKLDVYCRDLMACRVLIEKPHRHHAGGNRFHVRIDLTAPGTEIAVTQAANLHTLTKGLEAREWVKAFDVEGMRKDIRLVIREAFDIARRRLQDYTRRRRGAVKTHEETLRSRQRRIRFERRTSA